MIVLRLSVTDKHPDKQSMYREEVNWMDKNFDVYILENKKM